MRMSLDLFDEILERVRPAVSGPGINARASLDPVLKFTLNLRPLATGGGHPSLGFYYRVSKTSSAVPSPRCVSPSWKPTGKKCSSSPPLMSRKTGHGIREEAAHTPML